MIFVATLVTFVVKEFKDEYIISEIENFKRDGILRKLVFSFTMGSFSKENLPGPPTASYIAQTRLNRLNESKMVKVLIEIVTFLIYVGLCLLIVYGRRDPHAYLMTKNIKDIFAKNKFDQVRLAFFSFYVVKFDIKYISLSEIYILSMRSLNMVRSSCN